MKRLVLSIIALLVLSASCMVAQGRFGILAGIDAHKVGAAPFTFPGATAGVFVESGGIMGEHFRLKAELEYTYSPENYHHWNMTSTPYKMADVSENFHQITVPVMLEYGFLKDRLRIVAGASTACAMSMKRSSKWDGVEQPAVSYKYGDYGLDAWRKYLLAGVEYDLNDTVGLRLRYSVALTTYGTQQSHNKTIHLGMNFYL